MELMFNYEDYCFSGYVIMYVENLWLGWLFFV